METALSSSGHVGYACFWMSLCALLRHQRDDQTHRFEHRFIFTVLYSSPTPSSGLASSQPRHILETGGISQKPSAWGMQELPFRYIHCSLSRNGITCAFAAAWRSNAALPRVSCCTPGVVESGCALEARCRQGPRAEEVLPRRQGQLCREVLTKRPTSYAAPVPVERCGRAVWWPP